MGQRVNRPRKQPHRHRGVCGVGVGMCAVASYVVGVCGRRGVEKWELASSTNHPVEPITQNPTMEGMF